MWAANTAIGYPYNVKRADMKTPSDFALLDTNQNGELDSLDDPYGPYWPGDEFVDWVGISSYWYPDSMGEVNPSDGFFTETLAGNGRVTKERYQVSNFLNFYKRFAEEKNKPMGVA